MMADRRVLLSLILVLAVSTQAFYLPGLAPTNFCRKQIKDKDPKANCKVRTLPPRLPNTVRSCYPPLLCYKLFDLSRFQVDVFVHVNKLDSIETIVPYEYSR